MNVSRKAMQIRGDVPGLLRPGMPVYPPDTDLPLNPDEHDSAVVCAMPDADWLSVEPGASTWIGYARFNTWRQPRPVKPHLLTIDYTDPAALYLSLHWLADRGHLCGWMLPTTHGGRVGAWDGLTAWEVSAILVSHEVALRAAGRPGIKHLLADYRPETLVGRNGREEYLSRWAIGGVRRIGPPRVVTIGPDGWHYDRAVLARGADVQTCDHDKGPETGSAGKLAADTAALTEGCCLQVPGGLVVPT